MYSVKASSKENATIRIVWLHGWGLSHENMIPLASLFKNQTENYLIDFPGFGKSAIPEKVYSSEDYADVVADFIKSLPAKKTVIVGHSMGGRIAIPLAVKYPSLVDGVVLIGGAGIQVKHSIFFKLYVKVVKFFSPIAKKIPLIKNISLGSSDYRKSSGIMRKILKQSLDEDKKNTSKNIARNIKVPTLLIYGKEDTATPIYMGEEYKKAIPNSELNIIDNCNHWEYMYANSKQVHHLITKFLREKL